MESKLKKDIFFSLNGIEVSISVKGHERLIDVLRKHLALTGTKEGCGQGEWLLWLKSLGFSSLTGIDVAASELKKFSGTGGIPTLDGIGTDVLRDQEEGTFGLIHAKDLIEHLDKNVNCILLSNDRPLRNIKFHAAAMKRDETLFRRRLRGGGRQGGFRIRTLC